MLHFTLPMAVHIFCVSIGLHVHLRSRPSKRSNIFAFLSLPLTVSSLLFCLSILFLSAVSFVLSSIAVSSASFFSGRVLLSL